MASATKIRDILLLICKKESTVYGLLLSPGILYSQNFLQAFTVIQGAPKVVISPFTSASPPHRKILNAAPQG
jgi:hypothetical protein